MADTVSVIYVKCKSHNECLLRQCVFIELWAYSPLLLRRFVTLEYNVPQYR